MKRPELNEPAVPFRYPKGVYRFRTFEEADEWTDFHQKLSALAASPNDNALRRFKLKAVHALRVIRTRYFCSRSQ